MEWLKTLAWLFRGSEKDLIAFVAFVGLLMLWLPPVDTGKYPGSPAGAAQIEKQEVQ
jgi:hypothetical protein